MKQVTQNYKTGELKLVEVPAPVVREGGVLVRNVNSVVSVGTEKLIMKFANKSLLGKARARPDLARKVIEMAKSGGILEAYRQATNRLDRLTPLGYSSAGEVLEVGEGIAEFVTGDRVACARSGFASHAEVIYVPRNLCVKIPDGVDYGSAAFATVGAVPLHALRLCKLNLGENVAIIGLGLLGLLAVQLAKASGCRVFGLDTNSDKTSLAQTLGADDVSVIGIDDVERNAMTFTGGYGFDAVLVLASTTSNQPLELAADISREKGNIVVPGMVSLNVPREVFYQKELNLCVSKAWGAGFDDPGYELGGIDYPYEFVRWTARQNMAQFLDLINDGKVQLEPLITHRFKIDDAEAAYEAILADTSGQYVGVLLDYEGEKDKHQTRKLLLKDEGTPGNSKGKINVGLIGAGNFAVTTMLPSIKNLSSINLMGIATATGPSGKYTGGKFGFEYNTTDYNDILKDPNIHCVLIATRPNLHANLIVEALSQGKDVYVEKPLALSLPELTRIIDTIREHPQRLMIGYNRRFSSLSGIARNAFEHIREPLFVRYIIRSQPFSKDAYLLDPIEGGGIVRGDWGLLIDLAQFLTASRPVKVHAQALPTSGIYSLNENLAVNLTFEDGSIASLMWLVNGGSAFVSEKVEVLGGEIECIIDNFRSLIIKSRKGKNSKKWRLNRDMGHRNELEAFFDAIQKGKPSPVGLDECINTTLATFAIEESLSKGAPVEIDPEGIWVV